MNRIAYGLTLLAAGLVVATTGCAIAQEEDDIFAFIPQGGRSLLEQVRAAGMPGELENSIFEESGSATEWKQKLDAAVTGMDSWQLDTLAHFLAVRAPLERGAEVPRDGRDMALSLCQFCHIITVVITQDRPRQAWLGTKISPSHIEIEMTEAERILLADYLVINAGIPIDQIPQVLRAGGASY